MHNTSFPATATLLPKAVCELLQAQLGEAGDLLTWLRNGTNSVCWL